MPIFTGKINAAGAAGIFKWLPKVIRTRMANDLPTVFHEVGHSLDREYGLSTDTDSIKILTEG